MKRNVMIAGAVLMMGVGLVAKAETAPSHGNLSTPPVVRAPETPAQKQAKFFQLVNACLAERPGGSSGGAAEDILRRFRGAGN